jgi:membrane protease YdiL (CAAX protease family)
VLLLSGMKTTFQFITSLVLLALLPALFEEIFFRGALQPIMVKLTRNAFWGILLTSVLFSIAHGSYYGFLPRAFLGFMLGFVFYYGKNIWLNISIHFLNNAVALAQLYSLSKAGKLTPATMDESSPLYIGIFGILIIIMLLFSFKKESEVVRSLYNIKHFDDERMD